MMRLPVELLSSLDGVPGFDRAAFEAVHSAGGQVTSIRVNPRKWGDVAGIERVAERFGCGLPGIDRVPWSSYGYYLPERPSFTFDPLFHAGAYYVQEASSMSLEQVVRQTADLSRPLRVLDLCAAPGGKSTLLESLLPAGSLLVSNDVIRGRANILQENMIKWGGANVVVTSNDPRDLGRLENYFDVIVVDAPCSGSGLFRREPEAMKEWSVDNVRLCAQRQQRILADIWPALCEDGLLIYSTCSYSREENEDILDWMSEDLGVTGCRLQIAPEWNVVETAGRLGAYGYRFYPDRVRGEGLFVASLRKTGGVSWSASHKGSVGGRKGVPERLPKKDEEKLKGWVREDRGVVYFYHSGFVYANPEKLFQELSVLQSACYLKRAGVQLGKLSAKELIPAHDLAMSTLVHPDVPALPLDLAKAISYLRKDELVVGGDHRGWMLVQYEELNLGWMKVLAGRINNYYPKEWRILRQEP